MEGSLEIIPTPWVAVIRNWANCHADIEKVFIFGSYAKGIQHSTSDLDVAVIVKSQHPRESNYTRWFFRSDKWKTELQEQLPVAMDLQLGNSDISTNVVGPSVAEHGILVFDRTQ